MLFQLIADAASRDEFHDEVICVAFAADFVNRAYARVIELTGGARLAEEAIQSDFIFRQVRGQKLDCHVALDHRIAALEYDAHAPVAEESGDLIFAECFAYPRRAGRIPA